MLFDQIGYFEEAGVDADTAIYACVQIGEMSVTFESDFCQALIGADSTDGAVIAGCMDRFLWGLGC